MASYRIRGLAKLINALKFACKVIDAFRAHIRTFVPTDAQADYDSALNQILAGCEVIRLINYQDTSANTNAPWGSP